MTEPQYLKVPATACIAGVDQLGWAEGTVPVSAGGYVLGLRANSLELAQLLQKLFAERLVPDATPDRNYSVWLASPGAGTGVQDLHRVYRTFVRTMRTRSARRAIDSLWHELDARDTRVASGRPLFDLTVFVCDGQAHLLPGMLRRTIVDDLRRWEQGGLRLVTRPWVELDLAAGELVVPTPSYPVSTQELMDRIDELGVDDREEGPILAGRYPIASWTIDGGVPSPAMRVGQAGMLVLDRDRHLGPQLLAGLAGLLARVDEIGPSWDGMDGLRGALQAFSRA